MFKVCACYPPLGRHVVKASIAKEGIAEEGADHVEGGILEGSPEGTPEGIKRGAVGVGEQEERVAGEGMEGEARVGAGGYRTDLGIVFMDSLYADAEKGVTESVYQGGITKGVTEKDIVAEGATEVNIIEEGVINEIIGEQIKNCGHNFFFFFFYNPVLLC